MDLKPYIKRIRNEFPDLKFKRVTVPKQGMDHLALFLDHQWVFRFAKNPEYIAHFPNEVKLLDSLHQHISLPIPHYEFVSEDKSFGGYKKIHGKSVSSSFLRLSMSDKDVVASELAEFLHQLHAFPVRRARALGVFVRNSSSDLETLRTEYRHFVQKRITPAERNYCEEIFARMDDYVVQKHPSVMTHSDLYGGHILLTKKNRLAGIIDFGDKAIGDPAKDFNGLWDIDPSLFVRSVYRHYKKKDPTLLSRSLLLRKQGVISWLAYNAKAGTAKDYERAYRQFKRLMKLELD